MASLCHLCLLTKSNLWRCHFLSNNVVLSRHIINLNFLVASLVLKLLNHFLHALYLCRLIYYLLAWLIYLALFCFKLILKYLLFLLKQFTCLILLLLYFFQVKLILLIRLNLVVGETKHIWIWKTSINIVISLSPCILIFWLRRLIYWRCLIIFT